MGHLVRKIKPQTLNLNRTMIYFDDEATTDEGTTTDAPATDAPATDAPAEAPAEGGE